MAEPTFPFPLELRPDEAAIVLPSLFSGFFGLVLAVLCVASGHPLIALIGLVLVCLGFFMYRHQRGCHLSLYENHLVVFSGTSAHSIPYSEADRLLLRRSWHRTRGRWTAGLGLLDVAARLQRDGRTLVTIPVSWRSSPAFADALTFLETLPIPKTYL